MINVGGRLSKGASRQSTHYATSASEPQRGLPQPRQALNHTWPTPPRLRPRRRGPRRPASNRPAGVCRLDTGEPVNTRRFPHTDQVRIRDLDLAERLGYAKRHNIRDLIRRLIEEGKLRDVHDVRTVRTSKMPRNGGTREYVEIEYHLTREQALKVAARSETDVADALLTSRPEAPYRRAGRWPRLASSPVTRSAIPACPTR